MGFEMKQEKDVLGLIPSKTQGKACSSNSSSVNSPHNKNKKKKKDNKKKVVMTWRRKKTDSRAEEITAVRQLLLTCKEVFSKGGPGVVPSEDKIQQLRGVLEDVGLTPTMPFFRPIPGPSDGSSPRITYLPLHECEQFSIAIFCLPPSGAIPLHNHPGMTVFSKLLFGTMHIKSYDWVVDAPLRDPKTRLAKLKMDSTLTAPCNTSILYPEDGGNMHRFTAKTACAVLDVLGPPYCNAEGRHCTYFLEFPLDKFSLEEDDVLRGQVEKEGRAWLQERDDNPEDHNVVGALYGGPKVED
ncbi:plant cysteine oxidase 1 isoform X2 [Raphanus sativus]|uniref:cysteine dioxygenase n=1 Tax=Raphanus sativus TaxID=3726 RepID=A0A6J0KB93_RAPSA|nr:plant cysteine oxidase 1 isoform X2 [Raphanus sativus]